MKHIKAFWYRGENNFGDILTPWLINKITGLPAVYVDRDDPCEKFVVTGSILNNEMVNAVIWGAGLANMSDTVPASHRITAVRGPVTASIVRECTGAEPLVFGEPGILCGMFYEKLLRPAGMRKYRAGILPHYADYRHIVENYEAEEDVRVIDITAGVDAVLDEIASCNIIYTSSLHGIVAANSLDTPFRWVKFTDNVLGDGTKFRDYFLSINAPGDTSADDIRGEDINMAMRKVMALTPHRFVIEKEIIKKLLESCPFR